MLDLLGRAEDSTGPWTQTCLVSVTTSGRCICFCKISAEILCQRLLGTVYGKVPSVDQVQPFLGGLPCSSGAELSSPGPGVGRPLIHFLRAQLLPDWAMPPATSAH